MWLFEVGGEKMRIEVVTNDDREFVMSNDKHVNDTWYANRVFSKSGYII